MPTTSVSVGASALSWKFPDTFPRHLYLPLSRIRSSFFRWPIIDAPAFSLCIATWHPLFLPCHMSPPEPLLGLHGGRRSGRVLSIWSCCCRLWHQSLLPPPLPHIWSAPVGSTHPPRRANAIPAATTGAGEAGQELSLVRQDRASESDLETCFVHLPCACEEEEGGGSAGLACIKVLWRTGSTSHDF